MGYACLRSWKNHPWSIISGETGNFKQHLNPLGMHHFFGIDSFFERYKVNFMRFGHTRTTLRKISLILIAYYILFPVKIFARSVIDVGGDVDMFSITRNLDVLEDKEGNIDIKDLLSNEPVANFTSYDRVPSFGYTDSVYWVRFTLKNTSAFPKQMILEYAMPLTDHIDYYLTKDNRIVSENHTGYSETFSTRLMKHNHFLFPAVIEGGGQRSVYFRFRSEDRMEIPLLLYEESSFYRIDRLRQTVFWLYYGMLFSVMIFNLIAYFALHDRGYLKFIFFILMFTIWQLSQNGYLYEYIIPDVKGVYKEYILYVIFLMSFGVLYFTEHFLEVKKRNPVMKYFFDGLKATSLLMLPLPLFLSFAIGVQMGTLLLLVDTILILYAGLRQFIRGKKPARLFVFAWMVMIVGSLLYAFKVLGILPSNLFTTYSVQGGSVAMVIFLSFGLLGKIEMIRKEKEDAYDKLKGLAEALEGIIQLRTKELEDINDVLHKRNDELATANRIAEIDREIAANLQKQYLFTTFHHSLKNWDLSVFFRPALGVSGDFYDVYTDHDRLLGVSLFDVSGHGTASALITMLARSVIHKEFMNNLDKPLSEILGDVNDKLIEEIGEMDNYLTGIIVRIREDSIEYVNAGHPSMLIKSGESVISPTRDNGEPIEGCYLGISTIVCEFECLRIPFKKGDSLILYSDGLAEAWNDENQFYDETGILNSYREAKGNAEEKKNTLIHRYMSFIGDEKKISDDITLLVLDRL